MKSDTIIIYFNFNFEHYDKLQYASKFILLVTVSKNYFR